jgi:hypothetical protein
MTTPDALKLAAEYRQSMTAEVLHAWATDAGAGRAVPVNLQQTKE